MTRSPIVNFSVVLFLSTAAVAGGAQAPALPDLLRSAGAYVAQYEAQFSTMLAEEDLVQSLRRTTVGPTPGANFIQRRLRAEVAVVNSPDLGWVGFRDVFEVDGKPVHDRQQRLQELFLAPSADTFARAGTIAGEGSRFNLGQLRRNLSYPTMALLFLRQEHQSRSTFVREDAVRVGGQTTWVLRFRETSQPSLVRDGANDAMAAGRFWIEPDSGRVRRSQVTFQIEHATGTITVDYGTTSNVTFLVPIALEEEYLLRLGDPPPPRATEVITGRAQYSNFRQFKGTAKLKAP